MLFALIGLFDAFVDPQNIRGECYHGSGGLLGPVCHVHVR